MKKTTTFVLTVSFLTCSSAPVLATSQVTEAQLNRLESQVKTMQSEINLLKRQLHRKSSIRQHATKKQVVYIPKTKMKRQTGLNQVYNNVVTSSVSDAKIPYGLISNTWGINRDVALLTRRQKNPDLSHLILGGELDAKATYTKPYTGNSDSDLNLSTAKLVSFMKVTPWTSGYLSIKYDDSANNTPRRISNSNIKLDEGFITIGNFNKSPFYSSVGQITAPFGRYNTYMISDPLTYYLGNTKARALLVGYAPQNSSELLPYMSGFVYKGDAKAGNSNQFGLDAGVHFKKNGIIGGEVGASYIADISDSEGFQNTGIADSSKFEGFDQSNHEKLHHHVPAISAHVELDHGPFGLLGEYVGAIRGFNSQDFSYNGYGAKPKAWNVQGTYAFNILHHSSTFALGYSRSYQALGLNIPKHRYLATLSVVLMKHFVGLIEFDHDINYGKNDRAFGNTANGVMPAYKSRYLGRGYNGVTAKVNFYF